MVDANGGDVLQRSLLRGKNGDEAVAKLDEVSDVVCGRPSLET